MNKSIPYTQLIIRVHHLDINDFVPCVIVYTTPGVSTFDLVVNGEMFRFRRI